MWLINAETFGLEQHHSACSQPYAILSHTWGDEEVTFEDMKTPDTARLRRGFVKIERCCLQARSDHIKHVWIDTCCIDKSSSADVSEAINSMFKWYRSSRVCYAFLSDFDHPEGRLASSIGRYQFGLCRWFTRGWTLQELIAPDELRFYNAAWDYIGRKSDMTALLSHITGVEALILGSRGSSKTLALRSISVAAKMSWASHRETTRQEDIAYALIGIFEINMPLLYGEGEKAFRRLQEYILAKSTDHSILVWHVSSPQAVQLLAPSPAVFRDCRQIVQHSWTGQAPADFEMTNKGIRALLHILVIDGLGSCAVLNCRYADDLRGPILLPVRQHSIGVDGTVCVHRRASEHGVAKRFPVLRSNGSKWQLEDMKKTPLLLVGNSIAYPRLPVRWANFSFRPCSEFRRAFKLWHTMPEGTYNSVTRTMSWLASHHGMSWNIDGSITWLGPDRRGIQLALELQPQWPDNGYVITVMVVQMVLDSAPLFSRVSQELIVLHKFPPLARTGTYDLDAGTVRVRVRETTLLQELVVVLGLTFVPREGEEPRQASHDPQLPQANRASTSQDVGPPSLSDVEPVIRPAERSHAMTVCAARL